MVGRMEAVISISEDWSSGKMPFQSTGPVVRVGLSLRCYPTSVQQSKISIFGKHIYIYFKSLLSQLLSETENVSSKTCLCQMISCLAGTTVFECSCQYF